MLSSVFDWEKKFNVLMSGNDSKSLKKKKKRQINVLHTFVLGVAVSWDNKTV